MNKVNIGVIGANGRMGNAVISACNLYNQNITCAIIRENHPLIGQKIGDIHYTDIVHADWANTDVVIDFSNADAINSNITHAIKNKTAYLCCITGLSESHFATIKQASAKIACLHANNTSLGVHILSQLVEKAAQQLADYDIEILEMHHRQKKDSPSGTAILLAESVAKGLGKEYNSQIHTHHLGFNNQGREESKIGFASLRGGQVIGDHSVIFAGKNDMITLSHRANDRALFADGAIKLASWLAKQQNGLYVVADFLR